MTTEAMARCRQKPRKPMARLVRQLERELAQVRKELQFSDVRLVDETKKELSRKSDAHVQALNERDEAMNQRDAARCDSDAFRRERDLARGQCDKARNEQEDLKWRFENLYELNQRHFDRATRSADVAAVLAKVIIAEMDEGPVAIMKRFIASAHQMGVSPEVLGEVKNALTRGFSAQVEQAPLVVSNELLAEDTAALPPRGDAEFNREQAFDDIRDDVLDGFEDYLRGEHPLP